MKINKILGLSMVSVIAAHGLYGVEKEQLGNVKVTANKVEENVQEIPQSITVIDKEVLEERGIDTVGKVIEEIPNMAISDRKVFGSPVNFRGLNSSVFTYSNPVVIYINGVPIVNSSSYKASLSNVKRVEVL
ncbi:MAG: TonB-dependent receptor plug domain-containing protein, partial [Campylobacterales bacterium]|nr:TonB-dependent receptor plug domain-containing protein [Campylobacterales bacterium]